MRFNSWRFRRAAMLSPEGRDDGVARRAGRGSASRAAWMSGLAAGTAAAAAGPAAAGGSTRGGGSTQEVDPGVGGLRRDGVIGLCAHAVTPTVKTASNTDPPKTRFITSLAPE